MTIDGIWLPIVTPFVDGQVDYQSLTRLIDHYIGRGYCRTGPHGDHR